MAILVDQATKLLVQGLTGREGSFHGLRNREYGTDLVAGVTPGKGGQDVDGVPVFDTVHEAVAETAANTAMGFVPPPFAAVAIYESADAGIETIICITEGIPAHDMLRAYNYLQGTGSHLIGPNCPGVLSPGKANVGIIPAHFFSEGGVGLLSRSGTLTYQIGNELAQLGVGNSTIVGIGGDPIIGSSFIDLISLFEQDDQTELIVMVGEIGGDEEERTAGYIEEHVTKPVVAYIAGFTAPPGKRMGHAGAIISGSSGTAQAKAEALEAKRVPVGRNPTEVARIAAERVGAAAQSGHHAGAVAAGGCHSSAGRRSGRCARLRAGVRVRPAARLDRRASRGRAHTGRGHERLASGRRDAFRSARGAGRAGRGRGTQLRPHAARAARARG